MFNFCSILVSILFFNADLHPKRLRIAALTLNKPDLTPHTSFFLRSTTTCKANCALYMRATVFLTSLNVLGTEQTGEPSSLGINLWPLTHNLRGVSCYASVLSQFLFLPSVIMTGAYNNYFRMFDRASRRDVTLEASRELCKRRAVLQPRRVCVGRKRKETDVSVDSLDFRKKILHTAWHPKDNIIAIAASNNLYIFQDRMPAHGHHHAQQIQSAPPEWDAWTNLL